MNKTAWLVLLMMIVAGTGWFALRRKAAAEPKVGGLYSVADENGYRVAKVLVIDADAIHVRIYKNVFQTRPVQVDESQLSLGTIHDSDGFGMGHVPLSRDAFRSYHPVFVKLSSVRKDELEGYELWKESGGGVWK